MPTAAPGAVVAEGALRIIESGAAGDRWLSTHAEVRLDAGARRARRSRSRSTWSTPRSADGKPAERIGYFIALHDFNDNSSTAGGNILIDGNPGGGATVHVDYPGEDAKVIGRDPATPYTAAATTTACG